MNVYYGYYIPTSYFGHETIAYKNLTPSLIALLMFTPVCMLTFSVAPTHVNLNLNNAICVR